MMRWMQRNGVTCTTADLYSDADLRLDIQATGLEDSSYDVVIANHVLEHVDDFRKALQEVHRILRSNGFFICSFPMDPKVDLIDEEIEPLSEKERIHRFGQNDHKRVFGMKADKLLNRKGAATPRVKAFMSVGRNGPLSHAIKYGRSVGQLDIGTKIVPMTDQTMSADAVKRLRALLPESAKEIFPTKQ